MDLNGLKGPNILGRDLRYFTIDPKYKSAIDRTADDVIAEKPYLVEPKEPECSSCDCDPKFCPPTSACDSDPNGLECCQTRAGSIASPSDPCCSYPAIKSVQSVCTEPTPTPPCTSCSCNPAFCTTPAEPETPSGGGGGGQDPSLEYCRTINEDDLYSSHGVTPFKHPCCFYDEIKHKFPEQCYFYCQISYDDGPVVRVTHARCDDTKYYCHGGKWCAPPNPIPLMRVPDMDTILDPMCYTYTCNFNDPNCMKEVPCPVKRRDGTIMFPTNLDYY